MLKFMSTDWQMPAGLLPDERASIEGWLFVRDGALRQARIAIGAMGASFLVILLIVALMYVGGAGPGVMVLGPCFTGTLASAAAVVLLLRSTAASVRVLGVLEAAERRLVRDAEEGRQ